MKINFYLDHKHPDKKDKCTIFVSIHFEGKRLRLSTRTKVKISEFDQVKQRVIPEAPLSEKINLLLDKIAHELDNIELNARIDQVPLTVEHIKGKVTFIQPPRIDFFSIWDQFIQNQSITSGWTRGTLKRFATAKKHLLEFNKVYRMEFDSINDKFLEKFLKYHNDQGFSNVFAEKNLKLLKWFLNWATQKKYNTNIDYQSFRVRLKKPSDQDNIVYLTIDELVKVYNLQIDQPGLEQARDVFCFGCFTGLRYSDLQNLKKTDIRNGNIHVTTIKTGKTLKIPVNEFAKAILKKYEDYPGIKALPVISNQKYNDHLKTLGKKAELNDQVTIINYSGSERIETTHPKWSLLTTHVARKTFITLGVYFDIPLEIMIEYTGQTIEIVRRYYQIQDKQKEREMKKFSKLRIV